MALTISLIFGLVLGWLLAAGLAWAFYRQRELSRVAKETWLSQNESWHQQELSLSRELAAKEERIRHLMEERQFSQVERQNFLALAKEGVIQAANQVSSKLLHDHKQEATAQRNQQDEALKQYSQALMQQVQEMQGKIGAAQDVSQKNAQSLDLLQRALSAPSGVGQAAQTILTNLLKHMGLQEGRDYLLEYALANATGRLRPDAVVFLPGDTLFIIDAKSSKYLLELAEAEQQEGDRLQGLAQLRRSMHLHLRDLQSKDYESHIRAAMRQRALNQRDISQQISDKASAMTMTLMWLPNEAAIARLSEADPSFVEKAAQSKIFVVSTSGLAAAIGLSENYIRQAQHDQNLAEIAATSEILIAKLKPLFDHLEKMRRGLASASGAFDAMIGSLNRQLFPQVKKLHGLGVALPNSMPLRLESLHDQPRTIDGKSMESDNASEVDDLMNDPDTPLLTNRQAHGNS